MLKIGQIVTLTDEEVREAEELVDAILSRRKRLKKKNLKQAPMLSGRETWILGTKAEFAFCKAMNLEPDRTVTDYNHTSTDCSVNGAIIDVKAGRFPEYNLIVPLYCDVNEIEILALMNRITISDYIFKGAELAETVMTDENITRMRADCEEVWFYSRHKLRELDIVLAEL